MMSRRWLVSGLVALAIILLAGRIISAWYVDFQWYAVNGASGLWWTRTSSLALLRGAVFVVVALFAFANLFAVRRSIRSLRLPRRIGNLEFSEEVSARILNRSVISLSVIIGILFALPHNDWIQVELVRHGLPFGETDPYFRFDLGAWMYALPLEASAHTWALIVLLLLTLLVVFLYALTPSLRWEEGQLHVTGHVRRHMSTLAAVLLVLLAWGYRLDAYGLLHEGTGPFGALSAVDHRLGIPANLTLAMLAIASAMLVAWAGWIGQTKAAFVTITIMLLAALTGRQVVPAVAGRFVTSENPEAEEQSYREIRNAYTRRAYGVDGLERTDLSEALPFADAIRGASLWDGGAMRRVIAATRQGSKPNGALGWHGQEGRLVAFALEQPIGPQAVDSLPSWGINRIAADVTDDRGAPVGRDDPTFARALRGVLVHDSAATYYVLSDTGRQIVAASMDTFIGRLAYAWHLQNLSLLRQRVGNAPARILLRRDVRERVADLYPYFAQDERLTPIVWRDSVFWAVHLYATSNWYPLSGSQQLGRNEVRYLHHAGVAVINGHTGRTTTIPSPRGGPMAASWMRRFPDQFTDASSFEPGFLVRLPPAIDGGRAIAEVLATAGLRGEFDARAHLPPMSADSLYSATDPVPWFDGRTNSVSVAIPLLDPTEDVRGILVAPGGAGFRFQWIRNTSSPLRWTRVAAQLQAISDSVLGSGAATRPLAGPIRILPTADGLVAIQTQYAVRPDGVPQVLLALVTTREGVRSGRTLADAAGMPHPMVTTLPVTPEDFRRRVNALYESMREAMRRGDWTGIGAAYEALGRLLRMPPP